LALPTKKDAASCEMPREGACNLRSGGVLMRLRGRLWPVIHVHFRVVPMVFISVEIEDGSEKSVKVNVRKRSIIVRTGKESKCDALSNGE